MKITDAPQPEKNSFISIAKGFSIIAIVLYHYLPYVRIEGLLSNAYYFGGAGIYIFLFASGYGLYHSRFTTWGDYYRKRFSRVVLPYYLGITMIFVLNLWLQVYPDSWREYLSHIFLFKMFYEPYTSSFGNHFWFISTIIQFYVLWPFILALVNKRPAFQAIAVALLVSVIYSMLLTTTSAETTKIWLRFVPQYLWVLVLGSVVAKENWLPKLLKISPWIYLITMVFSLGVVLAMELYAGAGAMLFNDYFMFFGFASCCGLCYNIGSRFMLLNRFLMWTDSFSYALYIWHMFVYMLYLTLRRQSGILLEELPFVFAIAVVTAIVFNKAVNQVIRIRLHKNAPVRQLEHKKAT